ncbi:CD109 antigen-like [Centruroides sculpturatus]|uniref:CD109 antigen-like n=1 Tax=Centruroides sculpturatus TaxID=218467 RepID=UPI000C6CD21E|nr:CD109 antigen-like [Centruroides sculpturatus]
MLIFYLITLGCWRIASSQADHKLTGYYNDILQDVIKNQPTYMIIASRVVRPGQVYRVMATVYQSSKPIIVKASIQRDGVELASAFEKCKDGISETLLLQIPTTTVPGIYKLRIEGNSNSFLGGALFVNESYLQFHQRFMTIFIQTDRPIYKQGQTVQFRAIPITTNLKAFPEAVDVYMLDPRRNIVRRWLSRQTNYGAVILTYALSEQPVYGNWTIQVIAQGQIEECNFLVEEYYQTQYEVNVTTPAFLVDTESYLTGSVMANYTSGVPVTGNLTIVATVQPIQPHYRLAEKSYPAVTQTFTYFDGYMDFRFSMMEFEKYVPKLDKSKITVTAYVGERFLNMIETGFSQTLIFSSYIKLKFLGSTPQIFKPLMPFKAYLAVSNHDGTPLSKWQLTDYKLEISPTVEMRDGVRRKLRLLDQITKVQEGIWEVTVSLESLIRNKRELYDVQSLTLQAIFFDDRESAETELKVYSTYSESNNQLQITTSTKAAKVGQYIIFHVRSDYYVEKIYYVILSKGVILLTGQKSMTYTIMTFAVALSPEMAPTATILVYSIVRDGEVVADSLTFPVNGISRNNFTVTLNNKKDKTGETIEVVIRGRPGSYVGLAAVDKTLYDMQTGNELNYVNVLEKMNSFDVDINGTHSFTWYSQEGKPTEIAYFPSSTYGIDTNRTFEYAELLVFTDAIITRKPDNCNATLGYASCLDGTCYRFEQRCDGRKDCKDGLDENSCTQETDLKFSNFRMYRLNHIQRHYDNSWLWENINIGPLGHYIFNIPVPQLPVQWIITAFGVNNNEGFGILKKPIEFYSIKPFYMTVEMPNQSRQGEQIGIRISIFNYLMVEIEVLVILENSLDYKFVHVGPFGYVSSYSPRTSFGEHQHLIFIKPGKTAIVYMPIVPTKLGDINVTITAKTQVARDSITRKLHVEADGITQYRHTSLLLDLSQGAYLLKYLDTNITETPIVPYQADRLYIFGSNQASISVVGDVVGPLFHTMPVNASVLLRKPSWCGEQTMFNFAANLLMLKYLRLTGQKQPEIEKEAFYYLNRGYQQQLSYQLSNGAFTAFRENKEPSVWLTAFCIKMFQKATYQEWENFLYIDPSVISRAAEWILNYQTKEGSFYEVSLYPLDRKMNLSSEFPYDRVKFRNISLTAHVVIALVEVKHIQDDVRVKIASALLRAVRYLETNLNIVKQFDDPYELAIVSYALTIANSADGQEAFNLLNSKSREMNGMVYWGKEKVPPIETVIENNKPYIIPRLPNTYDASNVETTAYALLTYILHQGVLQPKIVEWLNSQRLTEGGWASTQDTIMALEALSEYAINSRIRDVMDVSVTVEVPSTPGFTKTLHINKNNLIKLQKFQIQNAWGPVIVKAQGSGIACVQLSSQYNVDWQHLQTPPPVKAFALNIRPYSHGRNNSHITFHSCQKWINNESYISGMTVLEVQVPTGYIIQQQTLDKYVKSHRVRNLKEARFMETKVAFYFNYLDSNPICLSFTVQRWYPVANMTRFISAKVYDYYAPGK